MPFFGCCAFRARRKCLSISLFFLGRASTDLNGIDREIIISLSTSFRMIIILLLYTKFEVFKSIIILNECSFWRCLTCWFSNNAKKQENFVRTCEKPMIIYYCCYFTFVSPPFTRYHKFLMNIQIRPCM